MPVLTANTAPKAFTTKTRNERNEGIEKPLKMVLISGMPLPALFSGYVSGDSSS